jgi:outer membrane protein assembly factor BamB/orotate phosphoribosyltransferase
VEPNSSNAIQRAPAEKEPSDPAADLRELRRGLLNFGLKLGSGVNKGGRPYQWMIDCRELLLKTAYLKLAAKIIWERIRHFKPDFVAGMTLAANPLTIAVMCQSEREGHRVDGLLIRREAKRDGLKKVVEGPEVWPGARIVLLDDMVHSGETQMAALAALGQGHGTVVAIATLVDCQRSGSQLIRARGLPLEAVFALGELGIAPTPPLDPGLLRWEWKAGPINVKANGIVKSSPSFADGTIVIGSDAGFVSAFATDGKELWRYLVRDTDRGVHSTPLLVRDRVFFAAYDGYLYCVDRNTGRLVWENRLGQWIGSSPAAIGDTGMICVGVEFGEAGGALVAVDADTGAEQWRFAARDYVHGSPVYDAPRRQVIFGANDFTLYAVDLFGKQRWQFVCGGAIKARAAVDEQGRCFAGSFDGSLYALLADSGELLWKRRLGTSVYFTPLVAGPLVIAGGDSHRLVACCRETGEIRWVATAGGAIRGGAAAIGDDRLAFGCNDGSVYLLQRDTGRCVDRYQTGGEIGETPAYADGRIIVSSLDGFLYCFAIDKTRTRAGDNLPTLKHFRLEISSVELSEIGAEIERNKGLWLANTHRQSSISVQRETNNISLRGADLNRNPGCKINDVHECITSANAAVFPTLMHFLEQFAMDQRASLQRAMIVRLQPRGMVYPHIEKGHYYEKRDRYHLVIASKEGSWLCSGGEAVVMKEGELWWFDNKSTHESRNDSDEWRVHVIFDLLPGQMSANC